MISKRVGLPPIVRTQHPGWETSSGGFLDHAFIHLDIMLSHVLGRESLFKHSVTSTSIDLANTPDCLRHLLLIRAEKPCRFMIDKFGDPWR
ncbi:MAG TPA: hypothetical protein VIW47_02435 [Nitrospiraceae bacterium]|jgi:hypothetical protein